MLEYCKGGDLSLYIQRHGAIAEATAKYFMQQLGIVGKSLFHIFHLKVII